MKPIHKIGIIALIYSALLFVLFLLIIDMDTALWVLLGSAVSMFNYGQMLTSTKTMKKQKIYINIGIRWTMIILVLGFTYFKEPDRAYPNLVYVLLGLISVKVAMIVYYLLIHRKKGGIEDDSSEHTES